MVRAPIRHPDRPVARRARDSPPRRGGDARHRRTDHFFSMFHITGTDATGTTPESRSAR
jgi:hypothetical protein